MLQAARCKLTDAHTRMSEAHEAVAPMQSRDRCPGIASGLQASLQPPSGYPVRRYHRLHRRRQRRQAMGLARVVAARIVYAVFPGCLELAATARTLLVHGAAYATTDIAQQLGTARRLALGAAHGHVVRADLDDLFVRNATARGLALAPEEGHTKKRAAGAARKAGIGFGHLRRTRKPADAGNWRLFYAWPYACKAPSPGTCENYCARPGCVKNRLVRESDQNAHLQLATALSRLFCLA